MLTEGAAPLKLKEARPRTEIAAERKGRAVLDRRSETGLVNTAAANQAALPAATLHGASRTLFWRKCSETRSMISFKEVWGRNPVRAWSLSTQGTRRIMSSKPGS